jgi:Ca2+-binding EF-hand superfamily protein
MGLREILEFIVNIITNAAKSEELKQKLNDHFTFEPYAIFSRIDRDDKKYINRTDLIAFLLDNNIAINTERSTVDLFIEYYDRDFDEKLNFTEFLNFILNKENNLIRSISTQRETYKLSNDEFLEKELEELTSKVLMSEFYLFEYANVKKMEIFHGKEKVNLLELFIEMDTDKNGLISSEDIEVFLMKRKIKICNEEIMTFVALYDEDLDGELNWNEYLFMILPSPQNYNYDLEELKMLECKYKEYYNDIKQHEYVPQMQINQQNQYQNQNQYQYQQQEHLQQNIIYSEPPPSTTQIHHHQPQQQLNNSYMQVPSQTKFQMQNYNVEISSLSNILYQIIDFETQLENIRLKLTSDPNFNLSSLFALFDHYNNNYISFMDFSETLESFDIISKNTILLFSYYDITNTGRLTQDNFNAIFLPSNKEGINIYNTQSFPIQNVNHLDLITKTTLVQLFNSLINYMTFLSTLPKWYEQNKMVINMFFEKYDKGGKGYLDEDDFNVLFENNINVEDLLLIMERIDQDKDGKITYDDMIHLLQG